jgi:signal-transduction protein with cAMP-binding, CBS, and nucleotidyltransferase domain
MRISSTLVRDLASHEVVTMASGATLLECAQAMRARHVGSVILVDPDNLRPLGVVTDRDIVIEAVAVGLDVSTLTVGDIAVRPVVAVAEHEDVVEAMARMRECGVRRLPVTGANGHVSGILALDDVIAALAEQADAIVRVIAAERAKETVTRG